MLKCVFISRPAGFSRFLADWLAQRTDLQAVVDADMARETWGWRYRWFNRSCKRHGLLSSVDRALFRVWCLLSREINEGWEAMIDDVRSGCPLPTATRPEHLTVTSVNAPEVQALLTRLQPDIIFAQCIAERMSPHIYARPAYGTFVYHEGVTPEYRGVHTVFWALANGDDDKVGYTLLRANDELDAGPVYAQGSVRIDPLASPMGYIGHWALYEGLGDVERVLREVERGTARPLPPRKATSRCYSYFPLTGLLRIRRRRAGRRLPWLILRPSAGPPRV